MTSHVVLNTKVSIPRLQQQLEALKTANAELTRQLEIRSIIPAAPQLQACINDPCTSNQGSSYTDVPDQLGLDVVDVSFSSQLQPRDEFGSSRLTAVAGEIGVAFQIPNKLPMLALECKTESAADASAAGSNICDSARDRAPPDITHTHPDACVQDRNSGPAEVLIQTCQGLHGENRGVVQVAEGRGGSSKRRCFIGLVWLDVAYGAIMLLSVVGYFLWEDSMRARELL